MSRNQDNIEKPPNPELIEAWKPVVDLIADFAQEEAKRITASLENRVATLEEQVKKLSEEARP